MDVKKALMPTIQVRTHPRCVGLARVAGRMASWICLISYCFVEVNSRDTQGGANDLEAFCDRDQERVNALSRGERLTWLPLVAIKGGAPRDLLPDEKRGFVVAVW